MVAGGLTGVDKKVAEAMAFATQPAIIRYRQQIKAVDDRVEQHVEKAREFLVDARYCADNAELLRLADKADRELRIAETLRKYSQRLRYSLISLDPEARS